MVCGTTLVSESEYKLSEKLTIETRQLSWHVCSAIVLRRKKNVSKNLVPIFSELMIDHSCSVIYDFLITFMFQVPHTTFLLTHACFLFYHMASNMTLRRLRHSTAHLPQSIRWLFEAAWVLALSYFIAYLETLAIANVCSSLYLPFHFLVLVRSVFLLYRKFEKLISQYYTKQFNAHPNLQQ